VDKINPKPTAPT